MRIVCAPNAFKESVSAAVPIVNAPMTLDRALATGEWNLEQAVETTCRLLGLGRGRGRRP